MRWARLICFVPTGSIVVNDWPKDWPGDWPKDWPGDSPKDWPGDSPKDWWVTRFTNSICSFSTSAHFRRTAARSGNAFGLNRVSWRVHKSVRKAELGDGSIQYVSQVDSLPTMCTSVSRTERKLPPRSRVNSSALRVEAACKTLLFAQRSYS